MRDLVGLVKEKTPFSKWPVNLYTILWSALNPCDNDIETEKSANFVYCLDISVDLPEPTLTEDQLAHRDIKFWRSVERTRADLAGLIKFKAARGIRLN